MVLMECTESSYELYSRYKNIIISVQRCNKITYYCFSSFIMVTSGLQLNLLNLLNCYSTVDGLQERVDRLRYLFFLNTSNRERESNPFYQHDLGYTSPNTLPSTFYTWDSATVIWPTHTALPNVLVGPIHLPSSECLQSHLQNYSLNTVIHPRPTFFQLLSLESWRSILLLHFQLSPASCNDTSPAYQRGISRTWAATGEKRFTWMLPSPTWTSHPVPLLDYSSFFFFF